MSPRTILGSARIGAGPRRVMVLNDWLSDTTSWAPTWPLLDIERCSWVFADLRGYGASREMEGDHTLAEAALDVLHLADSLGWDRFAIVGHSMSSLVALHLAQASPDRIARAVVVTPPPPAGLGADAATVAYLQQLALGDDAARLDGLAAMWGERLGPRWRAFKARQWRQAATPAAACGYVAMFAPAGLPDLSTPIARPVLAVTGEEDAEVMRAESVTRNLAALCRDLAVEPLVACGHYPMQECPPRLCEALERFLAAEIPLEAP